MKYRALQLVYNKEVQKYTLKGFVSSSYKHDFVDKTPKWKMHLTCKGKVKNLDLTFNMGIFVDVSIKIVNGMLFLDSLRT